MTCNRPERRRRGGAALLALAALALPAAARADERWALRGLVDASVVDADADSVRLGRNEGRAGAEARLRLWLAADLGRNVRLVAVGSAYGGDGTGRPEHELEQAYVRAPVGATRLFVEAGRIHLPLGNFASRYLSRTNPLVGDPMGYDASYPLGVQLAGSAGRLDFRVAAVDEPLVYERYLPVEPQSAWRPAVAGGFTPRPWLRAGAYATAGPYLNADLEALMPPGADWKDYGQRVVGTELRVGRGHFELNADHAWTRHDVPTHDDTFDGRTWFVELRRTWTPRWFSAVRVEGSRAVYLRPPEPGDWNAYDVNVRAAEIGLGWRLSADTVVKASWRGDRFRVEEAYAPYFPHGHAFAILLAQSFDVRSWAAAR